MTENRKKILFVHHGSGMGGAPQLLLKFLLRLDLQKFEPVIWCIRKSSASEMFEDHGFKVIINTNACPFLHISDGFYGFRHPHLVFKMVFGQLRSYFTAKKIFKKINPDLIHINSVVVPGILRAASKQNCQVIVNILECVHSGYTGFRKNFLIRKTLKWGDSFVFMLESEAEKWGVLNDDNVVVVYDFIEPSSEVRVQKSNFKFQISNNKFPTIGYLGRFTKAKGVHYLLESLGILKRRGINFQAYLIGPLPSKTSPLFPLHGSTSSPAKENIIKNQKSKIKNYLGRLPYLDLLNSIIKKENLEDEVSFTGEVTNVLKIISQLDVLAAPFTEPHFSRLCGEAAMIGKVIVAFDIDGPGEEIIDGETGFLVKPFDVKEFADKLEVALTNLEMRKEMGRKAINHAKKVFDADKNFEKVMKLYL